LVARASPDPKIMPGGKHETMRGWSPEEDQLLLQLIQTSGKRWKIIAEALGKCAGGGAPRTPAMVRNRFLRIERGKWLTERGMSKNRCGQCGQLKRGHVCQAPRALVATSFHAQEARHEAARLQYGDGFLAENACSDSAIYIAAPSAIAPPSLRTQDSMEILAMASETHLQAMASDEEDESATPVAVAVRADDDAPLEEWRTSVNAFSPSACATQLDPSPVPTAQTLPSDGDLDDTARKAACNASDTVSHTSATSVEA